MRRDCPRPDPVKIEYTNAGGKKYSGWYTIEHDGIGLTVTSAWGNKYALLHRSRPEVLAPIMLRGLVEEAKRRGDL